MSPIVQPQAQVKAATARAACQGMNLLSSAQGKGVIYSGKGPAEE
jgi:hypothetical protein